MARFRSPALPSLEELFRGAGWFGVETASPLQRAICRISDGLSLGGLAQHPHVIAALAGTTTVAQWRTLLWGAADEQAAVTAQLDRSAVDAWERQAGERPRHMLIICGVRGGKTLLASAAIMRGSQLAELESVSPGDIPRASFISLDTRLAVVAYRHLVGAVQASPRLSSLVVGTVAGGRFVLRRPDLKYVEFEVVAAAGAGSSLAARWNAGVVFDEAPRMGGVEAANDYDAMRAVGEERLLPGAQMFSIGSPWAAAGPVYELVRQHRGAPSRDIVVIRAPAPALNPVWWTQERVEEHERRSKETGTEAIAAASIWAEFIADYDSVLIPPVHIDSAVRMAPLRPQSPPWPAVAAMDPATRGNAWTLVIAVRDPVLRRPRVALARQWIPTGAAPLDVVAVLTEIRNECRHWGVKVCYSDQWSGDSLQAHGQRLEGGPLVIVVDQYHGQQHFELYDGLRNALRPGPEQLELPNDAALLTDLRRVRKVVGERHVRPMLPRTPDGRHCDYAPPCALVVRHMPAWQPIERVTDEDDWWPRTDPLDRSRGGLEAYDRVRR